MSMLFNHLNENANFIIDVRAESVKVRLVLTKFIFVDGVSIAL